ncbi:hypothetical protein F5ESL0233_08060 [Lactobacillus sp. ESL0233]|nr:hypothetical protein F5ESL0233_08060 [Lactobacillus sp. ESL0233]
MKQNSYYNLRFNLDENEMQWVKDLMQKNNLKNKKELFKFMRQKTEAGENLQQMKKQISFTKKQVGILSEMISEYFSYKGIKNIGYGIEADVYKSASKLVDKRINDQMQKNHGQIL